MRRTAASHTRYLDFLRRFPRLGEAWGALRAAGRQGPLDPSTRRLVQLAFALGAQRDAAVRSGFRRALREGVTPAALRQCVALAAGSLGLAAAAAADQALREAESRPPARAGLVLLTGGQGRRFGGPKHAQPHPAGGSWGGHLVACFQAVVPGGPVQVLGEPLPDRPDLPARPDPGQGPAAALAGWALAPRSAARRWWVVACDQVRWTAADLEAWLAAAEAADPEGGSWVMARAGDRLQVLGGFVGDALVPRLLAGADASLKAMAAGLPCVTLPWSSPCWRDVDTPEALRAWLEGAQGQGGTGGAGSLDHDP